MLSPYTKTPHLRHTIREVREVIVPCPAREVASSGKKP